jgi:hypothetical protein
MLFFSFQSWSFSYNNKLIFDLKKKILEFILNKLTMSKKCVNFKRRFFDWNNSNLINQKLF